MSTSLEFLGTGLITPLRRSGGNDFVVSSGVPLVRSCIRQIVGTNRGELRWRPAFGVTLQKYKNKINNPDLEDLVSNDITDAITQFEPRVTLSAVTTRRAGNQLIARISWAVIDRNTPDNQVLLGPDTFEVTI